VSASHYYEIHLCRGSKWDNSEEIVLVDVYFCGYEQIIFLSQFYLDSINWKKELEGAMDMIFCNTKYWCNVEESYHDAD